MNAQKRRILGLRNRIAALMAWDTCFRTATLWCFLFGGVVLTFRMLERPLDSLVSIGLGGLVVVCGLASLFSLRRRPSTAAVAALMDAQLNAGGLVMATESGQAGDWEAQLPSGGGVVPRWRGGVPSLAMLAALSFLLLAIRIPLAISHSYPERPLEIDALVEEMEGKVELLEEIGLIEEDQAQEWTTLMHALRQDGSGLDPAATWEALDQLSERFKDEVAVEVTRWSTEVQKREELIAALKAALKADEENPEAAKAARQELSELLRQAAENNPNLKALLESLPQFGLQQMAGGSLTMEEAKMLAERLSQMTEEDMQRMQQMLQQGMCQKGDCQRPGGAEALKKFLEENPGCTNLMVCAGMVPGNGGVNRGPGSAPISWLGDTSEEGVEFLEQTIPLTKLDSMMDSELVGESLGAPEADDSAAGSAGGVLTGVTASDSAATVHAVLPRHRDAVDRFFIRKEGE